MIHVVDDETVQLELCLDILQEAGFSVRGFSTAAEALFAARQEEPSAILSDVRMPGMDGFAFFRAYREAFPRRSTPFLFISSMDSDDHVAAGLDLGVDDYVTKPIRPALLLARIRRALRFRERAPVASFVGNLEKIDLMQVLQFCENQKIHGELHVKTAEHQVQLHLKGGEISDCDLDQLDRVFGANAGTFSIHMTPVDFGEISDSAVESGPAAVPLEKPMGVLSGVRLDRRLFQIQTEFTSIPVPSCTTIVVLDGRAIHKKSTPAPLSASRAELEAIMQQQHQETENTLRRKSMPEWTSVEDKGESRTETFPELLDEGYEALRDRKFDIALRVWEKALTLQPDHKTLQLNLEILRRKMNQ